MTKIVQFPLSLPVAPPLPVRWLERTGHRIVTKKYADAVIESENYFDPPECINNIRESET